MQASDFSFVLPELRRWQQELTDQLHQCDVFDAHARNILDRKLQVDAAIGCLELCQKFDIKPKAEVFTLPPTRTQTFSSEYRIVEDHESDNREHWQELEMDGEPIRLRGGAKIIR